MTTSNSTLPNEKLSLTHFFKGTAGILTKYCLPSAAIGLAIGSIATGTGGAPSNTTPPDSRPSPASLSPSGCSQEAADYAAAQAASDAAYDAYSAASAAADAALQAYYDCQSNQSYTPAPMPADALSILENK